MEETRGIFWTALTSMMKPIMKNWSVSPGILSNQRRPGSSWRQLWKDCSMVAKSLRQGNLNFYCLEINYEIITENFYAIFPSPAHSSQIRTVAISISQYSSVGVVGLLMPRIKNIFTNWARKAAYLDFVKKRIIDREVKLGRITEDKQCSHQYYW